MHIFACRATLTDEQLDGIVTEAMLVLPFIGERMIMGYIRSRGLRIQRYKVRLAISRIDPEGLNNRREKLHKRIRRRVYHVPHAHFMWHIDGNHKMIRWKFVVHAAVDGYSRTCVYLHCSDNNRSETVLSLFENAVKTYNIIPDRVRSDHGGENILVWQSMMEAYPNATHPVVLVGNSVHNQRVERFNRDLNMNIRQLFAAIFYQLENEGKLDVDNVLDIFALHYVFLPRINRALETFRRCHNNHKIRTEGNLTPQQLLATSNRNIAGDHTHFDNHISLQDTNQLIARANPPIPPIELRDNPLSDDEMAHLLNAVPPETVDDCQGMTVYVAVKEYVNSCVATHQ